MDQIKFSIIIPTYNRAKLLKLCIDSVESQTFKEWEAIVVDNYSEDNTEEIIKSYNDKRIVYVKNHNYGVISISRNKAIDLAKGEFVCFLDSDDRWYPNKLELLNKYTDDYDLIYHNFIQDIEGVSLFHRKIYKFYTIKKPCIQYVLMRGDPINPSCSCVRRSVISETRFSEDRSLIAIEDYDFFLQLILKDIKIFHLNKVLTIYDVGGCSHSRSLLDRDRKIFNKYKKYCTRNEFREILKYYLLKKGNFLYDIGEYHKARKYLIIGLSSKVYFNKKNAFMAIVKSYIHQFFNLFK